MARIGDQSDQRRHVLGRPRARHQGLARSSGVGRGADEADDLVDVRDRDRQTDLKMRVVTRLVEPEFRAARDDFLAEIDEGAQHVLQVQHFRLAAVQRDHVHAEGGLHRGETVELVQHDVRESLALQLDDDAHAVAVALVAQIGNTLDLLLAHEFGDALDQRRLVHLIGNLGDDQRGTVVAHLLDVDLGAHQDRAAARRIGRADAVAPDDRAARREIGAGHDLDEIGDRHVGLVDQRDGGVDDLAEIVRRDVGRHADRNAARAVDQEIRKARGQDDRFLLLAVVIRLEVDRAFVNVLEQRKRRAGETGFGIAHGRGRIAVDRAEIALPIDQLQAHREGLRHAHQRIVDRGVAVRVILTHDVADDARGFHIGLVRRVAVLVHREHDAAVHGLEAVASIRQRARDDHAHGVIEIRALHLVDDGNRSDVGRRLRAGVLVVVVAVGQVLRLSGEARARPGITARSLYDSGAGSEWKGRPGRRQNLSNSDSYGVTFEAPRSVMPGLVPGMTPRRSIARPGFSRGRLLSGGRRRFRRLPRLRHSFLRGGAAGGLERRATPAPQLVLVVQGRVR